jgi:hypothetical protein
MLGRIWHSIAVYYGFREPDEDEQLTPLRLMRDSSVRVGFALLAAATATAISCHLLLDISAAEHGGGVAVSALVLGGIQYVTEIRGRLPDGPLPPIPQPAEWAQDGGRSESLRRWVLALPPLVGVVWAGATMGLEVIVAAILPGQLLAYAVLELVTAWRVARWERHNELRVAFRYDGSTEQRFAVHPLGIPGRR